MLQKPLAFLLLISHINFFMFIAQVDEVDAYDNKGCRINDINSLTQYIDDVILGHNNKPRPDEDDDNARYFHIVKLNGYSFSKQVILSEQKTCIIKTKKTFPLYSAQKLNPVFYDVVTPPPRVVA
jgi:hypothetical protein